MEIPKFSVINIIDLSEFQIIPRYSGLVSVLKTEQNLQQEHAVPKKGKRSKGRKKKKKIHREQLSITNCMFCSKR